MVANIIMYASRNWFYNYRELFELTEEKKLLSVCGDISKQYSNLTKDWSVELNSEWTCRIYLATKMILNATVILKQAEFAEEKNLRVTIPYLEYYAVLSLLRAVVFTLPSQQWEEGRLIEISHSKSINLASDWIARFDRETAASVKQTCLLLKAQRELISYKAPASGDRNLGGEYDIVYAATLLAEVAQFNSELLEASVKKNTSKDHHLVLSSDAHVVCQVNIGSFSFSDNEDYHRMGYVIRKQPSPFNIANFMTEGQTEDFIGAWDAEDYEDGSEEQVFYSGSPSEWQGIFDIP